MLIIIITMYKNFSDVLFEGLFEILRVYQTKYEGNNKYLFY